MTLDTEILGPLCIARISGHVDTVNAGELEGSLLTVADGDQAKLLVDCTQLEYVNSAGLRVFLLTAKRKESLGGICAFCGLNANVSLVFETIGFDRILTVYDSRETALARLVPEASAA